jgi:hypothetical protein
LFLIENCAKFKRQKEKNRKFCFYMVKMAANSSLVILFVLVIYTAPTVVVHQEAKYIERWPNTTSAWAGWSRFDIPVDRYGGVHPLLICTSSPLGFLPATGIASRIILIEQNIKKRTGPALWLLCGSRTCLSVVIMSNLAL